MFAEELTASSAKKRQEQNRARRRQLKQQQQQQQQSQQSAANNSAPNKLPVIGAGANGGGGNAFGTSNGNANANANVGAQGSAGISASAVPSGIHVSTASKPSAATATSSNELSNQQKPLSAVERAATERKARQIIKHQSQSATKIQSLYRAHNSNTALYAHQAELLDKRLADLQTLGNILLKANKGQYVPPPATATTLTLQLLYLTHRTPWRRRDASPDGSAHWGTEKKLSLGANIGSDKDSQILLNCDDDGAANLRRLTIYLSCVILPGIMSADDNMDPFLPWLDTYVGRRRVDRFLRICMEALTGFRTGGTSTASPARTTSATTSTNSRSATVEEEAATGAGEAVCNLFRQLIGVDRDKKARPAVLSYCRSKLILPEGCIDMSPGQSYYKHPGDDNLDLIRQTRTLLLYGICGGQPIPDTAEVMRERCVSERDRIRADRAVTLLVDLLIGVKSKPTAYLADLGKLLSRFVEEILTVPLFTWKVSSVTTRRLITPAPVTNNFIPIIDMLRAFASRHAEDLSAGEVCAVLPSLDVPMTKCPSPAIMCLLANMVQFGQMCIPINGSDSKLFDFRATNLYFLVMASLVDSAPLGALSSRPSAVEWVNEGTKSTPIVLSVIIIDQCKALLADAYVRNLFNCAIDKDIIRVESIIASKNDKDRKYEKEMAELGSASAASLAAREARVDRSKGFWQSSKWAKKLSKNLNSLISGDEKKSTQKQTNPKGSGKLVNTSSLSRKLAHSGDNSGAIAEASAQARKEEAQKLKRANNQEYTTKALFALIRTYGCILARWGGSGKDDVVGRAPAKKKSAENGQSTKEALGNPDALAQSLLNAICFSTPVVETLWAIIQSDNHIISDLYKVIDEDKS